MKQNHPDRQQCQKFLEEYNTPAHVVGHCNAVAETACRIGGALNSHGYDLDLELVMAAGMIHDIARVEDEHWNRGAEFMEKLGYQQEADIIRVHMHYAVFNPVDKINETDLICLADKLVLEDKYAGLEKRMDYILEKAKKFGRPGAEEAIKKKKEETKRFIGEIENIIGITFDQLMKGE